MSELSDGGFFVVWSGEGTTGYEVYGKRYDTFWRVVGGELKISDSEIQRDDPSIASFYENYFIVVWRGGVAGSEGIVRKVFQMECNGHNCVNCPELYYCDHCKDGFVDYGGECYRSLPEDNVEEICTTFIQLIS